MFPSGELWLRLRYVIGRRTRRDWAVLAGLVLIAASAVLYHVYRFPAPRVRDLPEFAPGLAYTNQQVQRVPWSVHVMRLDRPMTDLEFHSTHAHGTSLGLSTLTEQIESLRQDVGQPVVGINGDFYVFAGKPYAGDPRGLQIVDGEVISAPIGGVCFWIGTDGRPYATNVKSGFEVTWPNGASTPFGLDERRLTNSVVLYTPNAGRSTRTTNGTELVLEREGGGPWFPLRLGDTLTARVREVLTNNTKLSPEILVLSIDPKQTNPPPVVAAGAVIRLALATSPDLRGVRMALGGGPMLVERGRRQKLNKPSNNESLPYELRSMWERHPRTALGWNDRSFYLVLVDGRQKKLSLGMTLDELAKYMINLGCQEVINLDGGGSSTMWCNDMVLNSPCEGWEREIANGLVVVRKEQGRP